MRIPPRYEHEPLITYEGDPTAVAAPAVRQRLRLAQTLATLGPDEWRAPSRCAGWTNLDVVVHLASTNRFWVHSISEARRGTPTRMLAAFDPVATPAELVTAAGHVSPGEALDAYVTSTTSLTDLLCSLVDDEWGMLGESPLGHVTISAVARHALWDAWVHERDIALGIGLTPAVKADELDASLRCAAALGPAFGILLGILRGTVGDPGDRRLAATVTTVHPATGFTVEVLHQSVRVTSGVDPAAPVAVHGRAVETLDGLSLRAPLDLQPELRWLTAGLERSFGAGPADQPWQREPTAG